MRPPRLGWGVLAALAALLAYAPVGAQDYPSGPVTFITPAAAGNSPDVVTRVIAGEFIRSEERLWWPIVRQINQKG